MNETSATSASGMSLLPDGIATLTVIHFTIIAVVAILVVMGLLWGIRAKRSRVQASRAVIANAEEAGVSPEPIADASDAPIARRQPAASSAPPEAQAQTQAQAQTRTPAPAAAPPPPAAAPPPPPPPPPPADMPAADRPVESDRPADEPVAATPQIPAAEAPAPEPVAATPSHLAPAAHADAPVTQLKGLGPKVATRLAELGVTTVGQMAALSEGEAQAIDAQLGNFTGRMHRDRWIEQARLLATGDKTGFEAIFGKL